MKKLALILVALFTMSLAGNAQTQQVKQAVKTTCKEQCDKAASKCKEQCTKAASKCKEQCDKAASQCKDNCKKAASQCKDNCKKAATGQCKKQCNK